MFLLFYGFFIPVEFLQLAYCGRYIFFIREIFFRFFSVDIQNSVAKISYKKFIEKLARLISLISRVFFRGVCYNSVKGFP